MRFFLFLITSVFTLFVLSSQSVSAQVIVAPEVELVATDPATATETGIIATDSAVATGSARIEESIQQRTQADITQTQSAVKSRLAQFLDENPIGPLGVTNFVQHAIRNAVNAGVPANMLVLMLMFPVIASLIAVSRHIVGLEGFGVYTPAVLAVAFLSTGIATGLVLFLAIIVSVIVGRIVLEYLKLQYLPRTALLLWFVSLVVFGLLLASPYLVGFVNLAAVGIFPILVLVLLSENFMSAQLNVSQSRLIELTLETLFLAIASALLMRMHVVQQFVILHPEIVILGVALIDVAIGKYTGLRITEYFRFKPILDEEEE